MNQFWGVDADPTAQGRIKGAKPVAVLDIGSNSVRLVVYERHARALTPLYNEKSACALGRGVGQTGRLAEANVGDVKGGTLYPLLSRLELAGHLEVEWRPGEGGPGRKYFALTRTGREHARHQAAEWAAFTTTTRALTDGALASGRAR